MRFTSHVPWKWNAKLVVIFHPRLLISVKPIANKYHEGNMKRTLKRGLKVLEIAELEAKDV